MYSVIGALFFVDGDGGHGSGTGVDFIMGHVLDHVVFPLHLFGYDLSITKHVIMMWIASAVLIVSLVATLRKPKLVPTGLANFFEMIVVTLEDECMKPYLGSHSRLYAPYLLTAFFFIGLCNFLGLFPFGATATSNISVTLVLAILTLITVVVAGVRNHGIWGYLKGFIPPGLPFLVVLLMIPVEIIGFFTRHFVLAMRLFANMIAGHIVIFTFISLIFAFKNWPTAGLTMIGIIGLSLLEVLISLIQAYIFTVLSAVFIGLSIYQDH